MMFEIDANPTFKRKVEVLVPTDGGHEKQSFTAKFQALTVSEMKKFDLDREEGTREFLEEVVIGLEDLVDESKNEVPFCDRIKTRLIDISWTRLALVKTYLSAITGARVGN